MLVRKLRVRENSRKRKAHASASKASVNAVRVPFSDNMEEDDANKENVIEVNAQECTNDTRKNVSNCKKRKQKDNSPQENDNSNNSGDAKPNVSLEEDVKGDYEKDCDMHVVEQIFKFKRRKPKTSNKKQKGKQRKLLGNLVVKTYRVSGPVRLQINFLKLLGC